MLKINSFVSLVSSVLIQRGYSELERALVSRLGRSMSIASDGGHVTRPEIASIAPFFIVHDIAAALSFYRDGLGFDVTFEGPADHVFFAIVCRGGAMIMLKHVGVGPLPNSKREPGARWDAYLNVPDPDALAAEFSSRNIQFSQPLKDDDDGLRGFELEDADGYVLFFGRPRS